MLSAVEDGSDFDKKYWVDLLASAGEADIVVGGDLNLNGSKVDGKISGSGLSRATYEEGHY